MNADRFEVIVEKVQVLDSVPSGSGLVVHDGDIYIVGDDATALYRLSETGELSSFHLLNTDALVYRIDKPRKHDLECLTIADFAGEKCLLAFGSGSVSPYRDSLLIVPLIRPTDQRWYPVGSLYSKIRSLSTAKELNLEAAVAAGTQLYLFNRSGNEIITLAINDLQNLVTGKKQEVQDVRVVKLNLSQQGRVNPGLSGGALLNEKEIIFCASAEDTPNAYDDGEVQGSFVGLIDIAKKPELKHLVSITDKHGNTLKDKLESIDLAGEYSNGDIKAFAVADNDDGRSKLFELRIRR